MLLSLTFFAVVASSSTFQEPLVIDNVLLSRLVRDGFTQVRRSLTDDSRPLSGEIAFSHAKLGRLEVIIFEKETAFDLEKEVDFLRRFVSSPTYEPNLASLTGLPLAEFCISYESTGVIRVSVYVRRIAADAKLFVPLRRVDGGVEDALPIGYSEARELVEGIARMTLAQALGLDLVPAQPKPVNGKLCSDVLKTPGGMVVANVDEVCSALGVSLTKNPRLGSMTFQHDDRAIILALGADKVKVGASWKALGWFVARRGEKWYVPLDGLTSALGE